ncbi:pentapeptide repeat-containing protein [Moorena sp. SIO4A5]|uniref:pentapeptide repeat-containing protein n=1 Tax=Moorena sp. SIO4A5 TaxID=2607838 RepID=UPI0013C6721A|nr:pentapeptide repeat-containing protein [Moorena sp. SIO4A5]NEO20362.1 pentapeptide repeat-containing protein [Moorena sp. SIO4A5]
MKANEVLEKYSAGERDFRRANLRGQSFQEKDLSGADFSEADIRGANFKNANLTGTKFCKAKAGLQRRLVIVLLLLSWITSGLSGMCSFFGGALVVLIVRSSGVAEQVYSWIALIVIVVLFAVIIRQNIKGAVALAVAVAVAAAIAVPFAGGVAVAFAVAGTLAVVEVVAVVGSFAMAEALGGSVALAIAVAVAEAVAVAGAEAAAVAFDIGEALALALALAFVLLTMYLGWRALKDDPKNAWIRNLVIGFVATAGTSFYEANLTDADFTRAILKSTDLTKATLTRSCWQNTTKLDQARLATSYLQNKNVRQLLITGNGQDKNFDRLDLRGINLKGANLQDASFIGTDLNRANLENANFSRAKLVQTLLEGADLTGATLTGACIEDWGISNTTKLIEIKCDYIFLKLSPDNAQYTKRRPADQQRNFEAGEFAKLAQRIPHTVDLVFQDGIDWQTFLKTFQDLQVENDTEERPFIQTMENKGDGAFVIRVKVPEKVDEAEYERKFRAEYNAKLEAKDIEIKLLYEQTEFFDKQIECIRKDNTRLMGVVETMAEKETTNINNIDMRDQRGANINMESHVDTAQSVTIQQNDPKQNINEAPDKNLTEAAEEIQQLLNQLSQNNPTTTEIEKLTVVATAAEEIKNNPTLKSKVIHALESGGKEAFKQAIDHPLVDIFMALIEGWREA